ncbi:caspase family protein [candidate division KSB1 bacterium]|nr:caspase family protein [candidate division KSB1 bacterium]
MPKRLVCVSIILYAIYGLFAQEASILNTSYLKGYDIAFHNPAAIAYTGHMSGVAATQMLYAGLSDNLRNDLLSFAYPLSDETILGLRAQYFSSDIFQRGVYSIFAGHRIFPDLLCVGLNLNFLSYSYNSEKFQLVDPDDPVIRKGTGVNALSVGFSLFCRPVRGLMMGLSADHLNRPDISIENSGVKKNLSFKMGWAYTEFPVTPQIDLQLEGPEVKFQTGLRKNFMEQSLAIFTGFLSAGREGNQLLAEISYAQGQLGFTYLYQYPLNDLANISGGSHQFAVYFRKAIGIPNIYIHSPDKSYNRITENAFLLDVTVSSEKPLKTVNIKLDNTLLKNINSFMGDRVCRLTEQMQLNEGKHEIEIAVSSESGVKKEILFVEVAPQDESPHPVSEPEIIIESSSRTKKKAYKLLATVTDQTGLERIDLKLNGSTIETLRYSGKEKRIQLEKNFLLQPDINNLEINASNSLRTKSFNFDVVLLPKPLPELPFITIIKPDQNRSTVGRIQLEFEVEGVDSLTKVIVKVNQDTVRILQSLRGMAVMERKDHKIKFDSEIKLRNGINSIQITANNEAGLTNKEISVLNDAPPPVCYSQTWAVIIGINRYLDSRVPRLNSAVSDAAKVEKAMREMYHFDHVITLLNEQATRNNIITVLDDSLSKTGENDGIVFYFAGHGDSEETPQGPLGYILPYDGTWKSYRANISMGTIRELSKRPAAKHIFYIIDSCFSGVLLMTRGQEQTVPKMINDLFAKSARYVLTAGRQGERALDGVFADRFVRGLGGEADYNKDGYTTSREIGMYVSQTVELDARERDHVQTPQFGSLSAEDGEFIFIKPEKK